MTVKEQNHNDAVEIFRESEVKITSEGKRDLGVVIGSKVLKISCTKSLVDYGMKQLRLSRPAYSAFVGGFKEKLTYFMLTMRSLRELLKPVEDVI